MPDADAPIFIGSCNGSADGPDSESWRRSFSPGGMLEDTPWAGKQLPIFSSSCSSGFHALYAAAKALEAGAKEAIVLGVDILSQINQSNFESLRVLADSPITPWQQNSRGFILGEAAVALKITSDNEIGDYPSLAGPVLTNSLHETDGLRRVVDSFSSAGPALVLGQGTGPGARDQAELAAFHTVIESGVPISTPLLHFGHTLGASGLLSIALAFMAHRESRVPLALSMPGEVASDGRPLLNASKALKPSDRMLLTSGALDGSCAGALIGNVGEKDRAQTTQNGQDTWQAPRPSGPLMHPTLRRIATDALARRPQRPPAVLVVRLQEPLAPPASAWFGERLLPSAVLEITPGFVSQLIARSWGFTGPALCMVSETETDANAWDLIPACEALGLSVARIDVKGTGDNREIIWSV
ncbi:MAG TPA: beta-ketoacyl synthase N-terminal-like domain-containing protein [Pyrinomonadaceae bacterium]|nr:beta-ketoacyl synthase N-terminal-like domain-containing protein [Pyrinomonadaceae bacterium]